LFNERRCEYIIHGHVLRLGDLREISEAADLVALKV